jgi:hypothetical protein
MQDSSGITSMKKIIEMSKIENEYLVRHDNNFEVDIPENTVVIQQQLLTAETDEPPPTIRIDTRNAPRIGLFGGRFQIRR